jgi:ribosomal protein L34
LGQRPGAAVKNRRFDAVHFENRIIQPKSQTDSEKVFDHADACSVVQTDRGAPTNLTGKNVVKRRRDFGRAGQIHAAKAKSRIGFSRQKPQTHGLSRMNTHAGQLDLTGKGLLKWRIGKQATDTRFA